MVQGCNFKIGKTSLKTTFEERSKVYKVVNYVVLWRTVFPGMFKRGQDTQGGQSKVRQRGARDEVK